MNTEKKRQAEKQTLNYREQTGGSPREVEGMDEIGEGD